MKDSDIRMTADVANEIKKLAKRKNHQIDFSDIPEMLDWSHAAVGKFYRPIKKPISLRVDLDVLTWFQSLGAKYQSKMNDVLRSYMLEHHRASRKA